MKIVLGRSYERMKFGNAELYAVMLVIAALLLLRDSFGAGINKFLFVLIIGVAAMAFSLEKVIYLISFVMPLYVGVPGNYLTLVFLLRFLMEYKRIKLNGLNLVFCILAGGYILVQSIVTNHLAIAELVFFPSLVLVTFLYSNSIQYDKNKLIFCYTMGVAALGLIMLISTLQVYDIADLLHVASRLGDDATRFAEEGIMNVSVDPNFFGMFAIAAISMGVDALTQKQKQFSRGEAWFMLAATASCVAVGLLGLSRAFFLVLAVWAAMYIISKKNMKAFMIAFAAMLVVVIGLFVLMPDVIDAIVSRFSEENASTAGGRTTLIVKFWELWSESVFSMLLGTGIFDCHVHCTPLQALFGGGLVFSVLLAGFILTLSRKTPNPGVTVSAMQRWLPMFATVLMSMTVPGINLLNFMYPIVFVGLAMRS